MTHRAATNNVNRLKSALEAEIQKNKLSKSTQNTIEEIQVQKSELEEKLASLQKTNIALTQQKKILSDCIQNMLSKISVSSCGILRKPTYRQTDNVEDMCREFSRVSQELYKQNEELLERLNVKEQQTQRISWNYKQKAQNIEIELRQQVSFLKNQLHELRVLFEQMAVAFKSDLESQLVKLHKKIVEIGATKQKFQDTLSIISKFVPFPSEVQKGLLSDKQSTVAIAFGTLKNYLEKRHNELMSQISDSQESK